MDIESCGINFDLLPWNQAAQGARFKEFLKDEKKFGLLSLLKSLLKLKDVLRVIVAMLSKEKWK